MSARVLSSLKSPDLAGIGDNTVAILPLGATEQHGPHLPLGTDFLIAGAVVAHALRKIPETVDAIALPALPLGASMEHQGFAGTVSLSYKVLHDLLVEIGGSLADSGIRRLLFLNAHGGNVGTLLNVTMELRARRGILAVATNAGRFGEPEGLIAPEARALDIHGGFLETSLMLAIRPELVDMDKAEDFSSRQSMHLEEDRYLRAYGPVGYGWLAGDLNPKGAMGHAGAATKEAGRAILDHQAGELARLIGEIAAMDITGFAPLGADKTP
ncbi:MAG: creatininase family protein [Hyphomicrobiaceae bacterium]|nr:creatininase family protein [Hyphomicrobiaceae bacterium]